MVYKKTTEDLVQERPSPQILRQLSRTPINVVVDNIRSLDNVGLIFRLCELSRVNMLFLTGFTGHPGTPNDDRDKDVIARHEHRIAKTAVYALPHQPWTYVEDAVSLVAHLKEQGSQIIAMEQIVGHEREGVRPELLELADTVVEIPVLGIGNSHNVATATGILLYHILDKTNQL